MTFCLGIRVKDGLVALADSRVTTGNEVIVARKVATFHQEKRAVFIMTSGLRSVRDKAVTYFDDAWSRPDPSLDRLFKAVNLSAAQVRKVSDEDRLALERSGLQFNLHALIGGQMDNDAEHKLYLVYPQGNRVEIGEGTAYSIIGASGYGKPVLDRTLKSQDSMRFALKVGFLAFDSTRISAADVDFPIDIVLFSRGSYRLIERRFEKTDLLEISNWRQDRLRLSVNELPLNGSSVPSPNRARRPRPRRARWRCGRPPLPQAAPRPPPSSSSNPRVLRLGATFDGAGLAG